MKQVLINGYCFGIIPAWLVVLGFRLFGLASE